MIQSTRFTFPSARPPHELSRTNQFPFNSNSYNSLSSLSFIFASSISIENIFFTLIKYLLPHFITPLVSIFATLNIFHIIKISIPFQKWFIPFVYFQRILFSGYYSFNLFYCQSEVKISIQSKILHRTIRFETFICLISFLPVSSSSTHIFHAKCLIFQSENKRPQFEYSVSEDLPLKILYINNNNNNNNDSNNNNNNNNNNHTCRLKLRRRGTVAVQLYATSAPNFRARIKYITSISDGDYSTIRLAIWMNEWTNLSCHGLLRGCN